MTFEFAVPNVTLYAMSKGGMRQLTRQLALEWAKDNVTVNALAPGPTWTAMADANPQYLAPVLARTPLGRFSTPDEMAWSALYLASDESSFMTGGTLQVDGGRAALNYTMPPKPA